MEPGQGKGSSLWPAPLRAMIKLRGKLERGWCGLLRTEPLLTLRGD